jgi:hypothetical protein
MFGQRIMRAIDPDDHCLENQALPGDLGQAKHR